MKSYSETNLRKKLKFMKCDLLHMTCSEVSYWTKTDVKTIYNGKSFDSLGHLVYFATSGGYFPAQC